MLVELLQKDLECTREEKRIALEQESKLMTEVQRVKNAVKEDIEKKYFELLEYKKRKEVETAEMKAIISKKNMKVLECTSKCETLVQEKQHLEAQMQQMKKDFGRFNEANREALAKQREGFE